MKNPIFDTLRPWSRIIFVIFIMLVSFIVFMLLGQLVVGLVYGFSEAGFSDMTTVSAENIGKLKISQTFQSVGLFVVPPIIAAFLFSKSVKEYLQLKSNISPFMVLLLFVLVLSSLPVINWLSELNQGMKLPNSMSEFEASIKAAEEHAQNLTKLFLSGNDLLIVFFVNIFIVAVLPAIGEELLFRGVLQKTFIQWTGNIHVAIWITAFLFSAIHFQFYGFLPRVLLGALFGYLLVWTGNMWVPITAHFINNAMGVTVYHFYSEKVDQNAIENIGTKGSNYFWLIGSVLIAASVLYAIYKDNKR